MSHWKLSPPSRGWIMAYLLLAACSTSQAPLSPVPPSATPHLPPTAIITPVPPTATLTASPLPGATFSGLMEISTSGMGSNVTADGGEIEFTVSEDGSAIASTTYILLNAVCTNDQKNPRVEGAWASSVKSFPPPPIENGKFEFEASEGILIEGNFTSETEAKGTIEISTKEVNGMLTCDFGTWNWSAIAANQSLVTAASDSAVAEDSKDSPKAPSVTAPPVADTPTPLPITIRVRMDNNPNGEINIEVMEGEYQLVYGTTLWAGSNIWEEEQYLKFPVGLAIEVGPAGLTLKGKEYPLGTLLFVEKEDQLTIVGEAGSGEGEETASGLVDEMDCQTDDGSQRSFYSLDSAFISHEVQIDGKISSADEWSTASCVDLRFHEGNNYDSQNVRQARWWVQNNGQNIYFLVRVPKDLPVIVAAVVYFWPEYTGSWAHSDNTSVSIEGEYKDQSGWDEAQFYEDVLLSPPGSVDGEGAVSEDGEFYWFEIKKDLDSGDGYDWVLEPGQTIGSNPSDSLLILLGMEDSYFTRSLQIRVGESTVR